MHVQDPVPASVASDSVMVEFPGIQLSGTSTPELSADGPGLPARIPTVFAPFYAGTRFVLGDRQAPPGVTLHFANVTLLLPNVTYTGVFDSGFMDFFEMGRFARMCFSNRYAQAAATAMLRQRVQIRKFSSYTTVQTPICPRSDSCLLGAYSICLGVLPRWEGTAFKISVISMFDTDVPARASHLCIPFHMTSACMLYQISDAERSLRCCSVELLLMCGCCLSPSAHFNGSRWPPNASRVDLRWTSPRALRITVTLPVTTEFLVSPSREVPCGISA